MRSLWVTSQKQGIPGHPREVLPLEALKTDDSSSERKNLDTNMIKTSLLKTLCKQKVKVQGELN